MAEIKLYGADWCPLTKMSRSHLDELNISYHYIDIDHDKTAAKWVADHNHGKEKKPTIDIDGEILTEPSNHQLDNVLKSKGLLS